MGWISQISSGKREEGVNGLGKRMAVIESKSNNTSLAVIPSRFSIKIEVKRESSITLYY